MQSKPSPRRVRVKDRRGIYYRVGADGRRVYEVGYRDSTGRQRWQTVRGGLKDAEAVREELRARKRRGERVAPTRATLAEVAEAWLPTQTQLRPRTRASYESHLRVHVMPLLGRLRIGEITEDDVLQVVAAMQARGYKPWTIRSVLTPFGRLLGHATRRGLIASNPMRKLERGERPSVGRREMRILDRDEIPAVLHSADPAYRALLATAVFTGLRAGVLRVRKQLDRDGHRVELKTPQAVRDVVLMPALGRILREHRLASQWSQEGDLVFASPTGKGLDRRNVSRRGLERAVQGAGLAEADRPRLRFHDLRHTFASLLIAQGASVVFVSRQLGHASPKITLDTYAHLFDHAEHAERARDELESGFGELLRR
jgi:integrase